jgi:DNA-binding transcriptional ArsR family regulator
MVEIIQVAKTTRKAAQILRAIDHKLRQKLYMTIKSEGEMPVTDIHEKLGLAQSLCSQHLAKLRRAGLVKARRDGRFIFYSCNEEHLKRVDGFCSQMVEAAKK